MKQLLLGLLTLIVSLNAWSENDSKSFWQADGGELRVSFFYDLLNDYDIQVDDGLQNRQVDWSKNQLVFPVKGIGGLNLLVPHDGLKAVTSGQLDVAGQFVWITNKQTISISQLKIRPTSEPLKVGELTALELVDTSGQVLFYLDHIHAGFNADKTWVEFNNMDLRVGEYLAKQLEKPFLQGLVVGNANMKNHVTIPVGYVKSDDQPLGVCVADDWPDENNPADIQLIAMSAQYVRSIGDDHAVFTPSATLRNVSQADVPWYRKFTGPYPPYDNDQHPYLHWSMYREIDGRFEQIGSSGIKHAFFSTNVGKDCNCTGGQVIFPLCEDTYGVTNNDTGSHLGPHQEISTFDGLWQSTGSFFDQDNNGVQDNSSNGTDENRMVVAEADFIDSSLDHYISSWYIIRDDINIYNSMGYRAYDIVPNGGGWIANSGSDFINGPASDQYVSPNTVDLNNMTASQRVLQAGEGHLTVAVKVIDLGGGLYRYNYMVENHDYDPQVQTITVPFSQNNSISDLVFSDVDENGSNDWTVTHISNQLTLQAPAGNGLDWGLLFSFSFTTDSVPEAGDVTLVGLENAGTQFSSAVITPFFDDLIFANGFEILN